VGACDSDVELHDDVADTMTEVLESYFAEIEGEAIGGNV